MKSDIVRVSQVFWEFLPWDKQLADVCNVFNFQVKLFTALWFMLNNLYAQFLSE